LLNRFEMSFQQQHEAIRDTYIFTCFHRGRQWSQAII